MARLAEIVELRKLGLSLGEVAGLFQGDAQTFERTLAVHEATLKDRVRQLRDVVAKVRRLRADLSRGEVPPAGDLIRLLKPDPEIGVAFELPWPWGGELFELRDIRSLNYIVGPLGSGKTRLAKRLAESLPDAAFIGLDRLADGGAVGHASLEADPALKSRVDQSLEALADDGGMESAALTALLAALESDGPAVLVVDMVEQGLDAATQEALIANLRRHRPMARPLFLLTRSSSILDLDSVGVDETIILYPANHRILAYVRRLGNETILVVNNLSSSAQAVELNLRGYKGNIPIEMFGRNMFPRVGDGPYLLTMGPYQFYWFRLRRL